MRSRLAGQKQINVMFIYCNASSNTSAAFGDVYFQHQDYYPARRFVAIKFEGWYPAHPLKPTQYGLLSAARLTELVDKKTEDDKEEKWLRGYAHIFETNPTIRILEDNGAAAHVINDATGSARYINVKPFYIEVEDYASTFGLLAEGREEKIKRQLEAGTQKSIEHEFMKGFAARANGNDNQYLTKASTLNIVAAGAIQEMQEGLGYLEYAIAQSPLGEQGVIHMTRDMAALLGSQWILERPDETGVAHLETTNGTPVVVGSGYDGSGPQCDISTIAISGAGVVTVVTTTPHGLLVGDMVTIEDEIAAANGTSEVSGSPNLTTFTFSITPGESVSEQAGTGTAYFAPDQIHKWMYATGIVDVNLGRVEVVNTERGHGYDVSGNQNDYLMKAIRPAAVHHEPSVHYGVKVQVHQ